MGARWGNKKPLIAVLSPNTEINVLKGPLSGLTALRLDEPGQIHKLVKDVGQELNEKPAHADAYQVHVNRLCEFSTSQPEVIEPITDSAFTFASGGYLLAIGAHWDDLLLGCLGTMIKLKKIFSFEVDVVVLCNSYPHGYFGEADQEIKKAADDIYKTICAKEGFRDITPNLPALMQERIVVHDRAFREAEDKLKSALKCINNKHPKRPYNLILSPPSGDRNLDHAITAEAAFSIFRKSENLVLEYDVKRYTENLFIPSLCIGLDDEYEMPNGDMTTIAQRKISLLQECCNIAKKQGQIRKEYKIENSEHLFSEEALNARMYVNAQDNGKNKRVKYAEIFHGRIEL
jgi:LmbE family N-acetylglucosaminyl deacetylase